MSNGFLICDLCGYDGPKSGHDELICENAQRERGDAVTYAPIEKESIFDKTPEEMAEDRRMIRAGADTLGEVCCRYMDLQRENAELKAVNERYREIAEGFSSMGRSEKIHSLVEERDALNARVEDLERANSSSQGRSAKDFADWLKSCDSYCMVRVRGFEGGAPYDREVSITDALTYF